MKSDAQRRREQRQQFLDLARGATGVLECPLCACSVKAKNLVRHYDRLHATAALDPARPPATGAVRAPATGSGRPAASRVGGSGTPTMSPAVQLSRFRVEMEARIGAIRKGRSMLLLTTDERREIESIQRFYRSRIDALQNGSGGGAVASDGRGTDSVGTGATRPSAGSSRGIRTSSPEGPVTATTYEPQTADCDALLDMARPDLYRRNAFRILGLPISSGTADVRRRQKRVAMQRSLGVEVADAAGGPLALDPAPGEEDTRAAMERLTDPEARLLDEIFWFWPTTDDAAADPALRAVAQGRPDAALEIWRRESARGARRQVATHNLAVFDHVSVLDRELRLAAGDPEGAAAEALPQVWQRVFAMWRDVIAGEACWTAAKVRVRELDDKRLTTGFIRRVRSTLPRALLLINARLATAAVERGDVAAAERHARTVREAGFLDDVAASVLRESLASVRHQVKLLREAAGVAAEADPKHANVVSRRLLEDARPLVARADAVLGQDDPVRQSLHDDVATSVLVCQIIYGNVTNDWDECIAIDEAVLPMAVGEAIRSRIQRDLDISRNNREVGRCHFCATRPSNDHDDVKVTLWGDLWQNALKVAWGQRTVVVPRCRHCARWHVGAVVTGAGVVAVIAFGLFPWPAHIVLDLLLRVGLAFDRLPFDVPTSYYVARAVIGLALAWIAYRGVLRAAGSRPWLASRRHSAVKGLLRQGWRLGEGPTDEQKRAAPYR